MFNGLPDSAISSVLSDLKRSRRATTEQILIVIQSVTERPARRILLSYAPPSYREAVESGKSWALIGQAAEKVSEGKHSAAYLMLKEALELEPDHVEARLQMAYLMRKLGRLAPWVDRELRIICGGHNASVRLNVPKDADSQFIAGRLAQLGGDAKAAERLYTDLLKESPDHSDAKAALKELRDSNPDLSIGP